MKFTLIFTSLAVLLTPAYAQSSTVGVTFDRIFDNADTSLNNVACSNGVNGLITKGFTTFGSLPSFPFIGGAPGATFNSTKCGTCWSLTFVDAQGVSKSIQTLAIDASFTFNIALQAMNALTNNQAEALGKVSVTAVEVPASACGL